MAFFVVPIEVVLPSQTEATHAVVPDSGAGSVPDVSAAATERLMG